ncbi:uncharacterized protein DFL_004224 [Arthrobotrys flagrans]|uniref:Ubiquitin-conjugating enzyme E2 2 n=1 Tax=Arthrobotrys flagrans TaxID=97331 RepID=A0A437A477_ARTFL|nr:hypothetical protein DFL_004224 [Arthrobotrys flagrans]
MAKQFRRLAAEHAAIEESPPPDYILPEGAHDDLVLLHAILVGPVGTPYETGAFRITIKCTDTYPNTPPTANFKTKIWHPNVDDKTGEVCVDTLKTSWTPTTTLRDVLEVIRSLLIHPNPSSALNSEAGLLAEEDFKAFARQAKLMTKIYAAIPADLKSKVKTMRQKADEEGKAAGSTPTTPVSKHKKNASASSSRKPASAVKSTKGSSDEQPAATSAPKESTAHANNVLHTPTKEHSNPQATPYTPTPTASKPVKETTDSARATTTGKENAAVNPVPSPVTSNSCRSRSSSPLGKRTFDEANEEGSLETDIRGEVDRTMSPPPAKRRSMEINRPETLESLLEKPQQQQQQKVPKSVVYSKGMMAKGKAPKGLRRL